MERRGQAALEFLMTYGWAILVVLIAIGALAYFGVLNPSRYLPNSCTIVAGISCNDFKLSTSGAQLIMRNGMGDDLKNVSVIISGCTQSTEADGGFGAVDDVWTDGTILGGSDGITLTACGYTAGQRVKTDVAVKYNTTEGVGHTRTGQLVGKAE